MHFVLTVYSRFEVHDKLQNFMAPVPAPSGAAMTWHDSQIDELFASLMGHEYTEAVDQDTPVDHNVQPSSTMRPILNDGFRVFG